MTKQRRNTLSVANALFVLATTTQHDDAYAQSERERAVRYFRHGADATSVPAAGQPGADYFSRGADVMSVPPAGQPGADFFRRGADVTSVAPPGQLGADVFYRGADVTSVPDDAAKVPDAGGPDASVPNVIDQAVANEGTLPLAEEDMTVESEPVLTEPAPSDGIVWLLPAWPIVVDANVTKDAGAVVSPEHIEAPPSPELADTQIDQTAARDQPAPPSKSEQLRVMVRRVVFRVRVIVIASVTLLVFAAVIAWRALRQRPH